MKTVGPVVAALAALGLLVLVAESAPTRLFQGRAALAAGEDISSNWSGYVATGPGSTSTTASPSMSFTDVTGQWVQPKASCAGGSPTSVAIWVGLGGYSETSNELEQTGTSADCAPNGTASYYAWYELVPADSVTVTGLKVFPGDVIASTVLINGDNVLVQVIDRTRKMRFTKHLTMATPDQTSAEWIVEAPTQCGASANCRQLTLSDFGSLNFTRSFAKGNGVSGTISGSGWLTTALQLVPVGNRFFGAATGIAGTPDGPGAATSALTPNGAGFTVTWQARPSAA
jgi:Peptidase A4 family